MITESSFVEGFTKHEEDATDILGSDEVTTQGSVLSYTLFLLIGNLILTLLAAGILCTGSIESLKVVIIPAKNPSTASIFNLKTSPLLSIAVVILMLGYYTSPILYNTLFSSANS